MTDLSKKEKSKDVKEEERRNKGKERRIVVALSYNCAIFSPEAKERDRSNII